jgi:hypothetical protein
MATSKKSSEIEVGEWVVLPIGSNRLKALVVEDRGHLGPKGERVLRVATHMAEVVDPLEWEVTEAELIRAA